LEEKPVISIVIEEAPRVLGADVLAARGDNIYSTIAREGRKFRIGLIAITQLVSLIPRTILANMNTKIILGNELAAERQAVMESAAQDLSSDDRTIASLDRGEAIVSSNFTKFAVPIQIPLFEKYVEENLRPREKNKTVFVG
jgi:DNA helicase HerA-like ATPase